MASSGSAANALAEALLGTPLVSTQERKRLLRPSVESGSIGAGGGAHSDGALGWRDALAGARGGRGGGRAGGGRAGEVLDDQGRRRLHGAFTGGFSAGYFNTVGSKDGWKPSQKVVVSRRGEGAAGRRQAGAGVGAGAGRFAQKLEDFMDEEDDPLMGQRLRSSAAYDSLAGSGSGAGGVRGVSALAHSAMAAANPKGESNGAHVLQHALHELVRPMAAASVGKQMLKELGWREGQGVGPRQRVGLSGRRVLPDGTSVIDVHSAGKTFAPRDVPALLVPAKTDNAGVGYNASSGSASASASASASFSSSSTSALASTSASRKRPRGGMGVGVFQRDADDDDVYDDDDDDDGGGASAGFAAFSASTGPKGTSALHALNARMLEETEDARRHATGDPFAGFHVARCKERPAKAYPRPVIVVKNSDPSSSPFSSGAAPASASSSVSASSSSVFDLLSADSRRKLQEAVSKVHGDAGAGVGVGVGIGSGAEAGAGVGAEARAGSALLHSRFVTGTSQEVRHPEGLHHPAASSSSSSSSSSTSSSSSPSPSPPIPAGPQITSTRTTLTWLPGKLVAQRFGVSPPKLASNGSSANAQLEARVPNAQAPAQGQTQRQRQRQRQRQQTQGQTQTQTQGGDEAAESTTRSIIGGGKLQHERPEAETYRGIFDVKEADAVDAVGDEAEDSTPAPAESASVPGRILFRPKGSRQGHSTAAAATAAAGRARSSRVIGVAQQDDDDDDDEGDGPVVVANLPDWATQAVGETKDTKAERKAERQKRKAGKREEQDQDKDAKKSKKNKKAKKQDRPERPPPKDKKEKRDKKKDKKTKTKKK